MADQEEESTPVVEMDSIPAAVEADTTPVAQQSTETPPAPKPPVPAPRPAPPAEAAWAPPSKTEWEKVTASLRDASGESAARKKRLRDLEAQLDELKKANATAEERAVMELEKRLLKEADDRWRPKIVAAEARSALAAAGCKDPGRISRLIDTSKLELGDDGEITGLDEQVTALKADYPEAFPRPRQAPATPPAAQPGQGKAPDRKRTATERQAAALLGKP